VLLKFIIFITEFWSWSHTKRPILLAKFTIEQDFESGNISIFSTFLLYTHRNFYVVIISYTWSPYISLIDIISSNVPYILLSSYNKHWVFVKISINCTFFYIKPHYFCTLKSTYITGPVILWICNV